MKTALIAMLAIAIAGPAFGQPHDHAAASPTTASPQAPGQDAFAAIREITQRLEQDPATDWRKVDIGALREHLVDMDNVMVRSRARAVEIAGGARFEVTADEPAVIASIQRMATAHARTADAAPGVTLQATATPKGAVLTVTASDAATASRIRALGFYGLLSQGDHHGPHHLMIAQGGGAHAH